LCNNKVRLSIVNRFVFSEGRLEVIYQAETQMSSAKRRFLIILGVVGLVLLGGAKEWLDLDTYEAEAANRKLLIKAAAIVAAQEAGITDCREAYQPSPRALASLKANDVK
jgi:hypothetical protein